MRRPFKRSAQRPSEVLCRIVLRGGGGAVLATARPQVLPGAAGLWRWHWYVDGRSAGATSTALRSFSPGRDGIMALRCVASRRAAFSGDDYEPMLRGDGRFDLEWGRVDGAVSYRVEWRVSGDPDWIVAARVRAAPGHWSVTARIGPFVHDVIMDLQVVPVDEQGQDGDPLDLGTRRVYRVAPRVDYEVVGVSGGVVSVG